MNDRLCIECFNELDDETLGCLCIDCEEGVSDTWPWEVWNDFEEMSLDDLEDPDSDEEE